MPSLALFGGHRPLAFLDGADPCHAPLKRCGLELHARLATEVRAVVPPPGTTITLLDVEKMSLVKFTGAWRDMVVESHDAAYEVKKGEMVFGYQPLAKRDERVFQRDREFIPDRFAVCSDDDERRRMLEHMVWSNGPETGTAAEGNKQCPGKDAVVVGRLMVAELLPHATARSRCGSRPWTVQVSATSARRSSTSPRVLLT
ncbi:allene oxide synthase 4-like [Miscanthus floridulus]|uniref:allene oxide synthase 4-like n=1 Tax=Miscanthus floridulus TaxID=154761 RepID=UPI00345A260B